MADVIGDIPVLHKEPNIEKKIERIEKMLSKNTSFLQGMIGYTRKNLELNKKDKRYSKPLRFPPLETKKEKDISLDKIVKSNNKLIQNFQDQLRNFYNKEIELKKTDFGGSEEAKQIFYEKNLERLRQTFDGLTSKFERIRETIAQSPDLMNQGGTKYLSFIDSIEKTIGKNSIFKENIKNMDKVSSKIEETLQELEDTVKTFGKNFSSQVIDSLIGPFQLVTAPLEELGGFKFSEILTKGFTSIFGKRKKSAPKRDQVLRNLPDGEGFVYIADTIEKALGGEDIKEEEKSLFGNILESLGLGAGVSMSGLIAQRFPQLVKSLPILGLIGSLVWDAIEIIKGINLAEKWGVSKVEGGIGAWLGGTGEGSSNVFVNAGRWALKGASIGSKVGGLPGALMGGLLGMAVGGVLGFIGGEKIAKWIDEAGKNVSQWWDKTKKDYLTFQEKHINWEANLNEGIDNFFKKVGLGISNFFEKTLDIGKKVKDWVENSILLPIGKFFAGLYIKLDEITGGKLTEMVDWVRNNIFSPIHDFFKSIGDFLRGIFGGFDKLFEGTYKEMEEKGKEALSQNMRTTADQVMGNVNTLPYLSNVSPIITKTQDAIITKTGDVIHTSPDDNLIATKNPIMFSDYKSPWDNIGKEAFIQKEVEIVNMEEVVVELKNILSELKKGSLGTTVFQNNYSSKYNPINILDNLTATLI